MSKNKLTLTEEQIKEHLFFKCPNDANSINSRIHVIEYLQSNLEKAKNGSLLQLLKNSLSREKRNLRLRLSKINGEHHTLKEAIEFIQSKGSKCDICGNTDSPTIDHIIPVSKNGHNGITNLRVLCGSCNSKKGNKI